MNIFIVFLILIWYVVASVIEYHYSVRFNIFILPFTLYRNTKMNYFGCWLVFILISILNPVIFFFKAIMILILLLLKIIEWICTVGRKEKK